MENDEGCKNDCQMLLPVPVAIALTTGYVPGGMGMESMALSAAMFLLRDNIYPHQSSAAFDACRDSMLKQHPWLENYPITDETSMGDMFHVYGDAINAHSENIFIAHAVDPLWARNAASTDADHLHMNRDAE